MIYDMVECVENCHGSYESDDTEKYIIVNDTNDHKDILASVAAETGTPAHSLYVTHEFDDDWIPLNYRSDNAPAYDLRRRNME